MKKAPFKYRLNVSITGSHKLKRFTAWAREHIAGIAFSLPPQAPRDTGTLTVALQSEADRDRLRAALVEPIA